MTKNLLFAALLVAAGVSVTSCGNDRELEEQTTGQTTANEKAHVRLVCGMDVGMITQAGYKTAYCILPIRTELLPQQDGHVEITVEDEWK